MKRNFGLQRIRVGMALVAVGLTMLARSQENSELQTREIWDTNLLSKRPTGQKAVHLKAVSGDDALVGITLWRLRPSQSGDTVQVRELLHEDNEARQFTAERLAAESPLHEGEKVRISIETARQGYLYVIDRDVYADGSLGDPYLIFPELLIRGGDNTVKAGKIVEIPSADDNPPFLRMHLSRADQSSELLTILVSPKPITPLAAGKGRLKLTSQQVEEWEQQWKARVYEFEAKGLAGKTYTAAEKAAAVEGKTLTQDDPVPQTLYHCAAKPGNPLLVELALKISR